MTLTQTFPSNAIEIISNRRHM